MPDLLFFQAVRNETGHYGTELFSEVAERIIDTHNKSEPLYLYVAQQGVHSANGREPLQAPKRLLDVSNYSYIYLITTCFFSWYCTQESMTTSGKDLAVCVVKKKQ